MKKSYTVATLSLLSGIAMAQSSVTVYGRVDQAIGKPIGAKDRQVRDGHASRLGFRGIEDLGGGWAAMFNLEHRLTPDTGSDATVAGAGPVGASAANVTAATATNKFWNGLSTVGLRGPYGTLSLGRQYTPGFDIQNTLDPFNGLTVAAVRDATIKLGGIGKTRVDDSIRYDFGAAGFTFAATIAEARQAGALAGPDRPLSFSATYTAGPLWLGAALEDPANANDELWTAGAKYSIGPAQIHVAYSTGRTGVNAKARGYLLGMTYQIGKGEVKIAAGSGKIASNTTAQRIGLGYHHWLSKRTKIYADVAHERKIAAERNAYDLGIFHAF
jgi:predicted porin